jgi:acyl-CoA synthetase (AMP-forming)/AMP-acid ligase II
MHLLKSMFVEPPAPSLDQNIHNIVFNKPGQEDWEDYTLYIDAQTGRKRTYYQFLDRVLDGATALGSPVEQGGLGLGLKGGGVDSGEMIGILSENCLDFPALVHSLLAITTPFALVSFYSTPFELKHALTLAKVTRLFVHPNVLSKVLPIAKELGIKNEWIYTIGGTGVRGRKSFSDMIRRVRIGKMKRIGVKKATKDMLAYLVFSSGTSGLPKGVMISHGNVIFSLYQAIVVAMDAMSISPPAVPDTPEGLNVTLVFLPFYHSFGLHIISFRAFMARSTYVIMSQWSIESALQAIQKHRITHLNLIPSVVHQLSVFPNLNKYDLSSLLAIGSGAAYLPPDLAEKLSKRLPKEIELGEGYGMSETTIAAMFSARDGMCGGKARRVRGATGILLPGMEARIVKDDGSDAAKGEAGELHLRGANIALGYWNNEKANKETFIEGGWLVTGDRFSRDDEGMFYFADRVKDTLKVSGMQVSPVEIENVLLAHPGKLITDATVSGVSGHGRTSDEKVPRAWVVLSPAGKKLEKEKGKGEVVNVLTQWSEQNLSKFKWLRGGIEVVKEIPKLPTGKTLRRVLVEKYEKKLAAQTKAKL